MSVQLHRRLAYRTGSGSTDIDTQSASFWDSTDYSSIHLESKMYLSDRYRWVYKVSEYSPYQYNYNTIYYPGDGYDIRRYASHAIFLGNESAPLVTFSGQGWDEHSGLYNSGTAFSFKASFAAYDYCGGSSLTTSKIARCVSRYPRNPRYFSDISSDSSGGGPSQYVWKYNVFPSGLVPSTMCCTSDRMHWYVFQRGNSTGTFYTGGGYVECGIVKYNLVNWETQVKSRCTPHTISTDYGMRILHIRSTGGVYPLQSSVESMMSSFAAPGTYPCIATNSGLDKDYGFLIPTMNREKWDFTLDALVNGDVSPAGYFTDDMPVHMQVCDGGTKMFFLSVVSTNGRQLSMRTFEKSGKQTPYDITNLSEGVTSYSLDLLRNDVSKALGVASTYFTWHWFKFNPLGTVLILLSPDGVLAKFKLNDAFNLDTISLVTAVRLPLLAPGEYLPSNSSSQKLPLYYTALATFTAESSKRISYPVMAADIDPDGNSLVISMGPYYNASTNSDASKLVRNANMIVQYRL